MIKWDEISKFLSLFKEYQGRVLGMLLGFLVSLLIIQFGIILALFIIICTGIGYYLGFRYDNKSDFREVINDILPRKD